MICILCVPGLLELLKSYIRLSCVLYKVLKKCFLNWESERFLVSVFPWPRRCLNLITVRCPTNDITSNSMEVLAFHHFPDILEAFILPCKHFKKTQVYSGVKYVFPSLLVTCSLYSIIIQNPMSNLKILLIFSVFCFSKVF